MITIDKVTPFSATASSLAYNHVISSQDQVLVIYVFSGGSQTAPTVKYNGTALVQVGILTSATDNNTITAWLMTNPPVGNFAVSVNVATTLLVSYALSISGVSKKTTNLITNNQRGSGTTSHLALQIPQANTMVLDFFWESIFGGYSFLSGQKVIGATNDGGHDYLVDYCYPPPGNFDLAQNIGASVAYQDLAIVLEPSDPSSEWHANTNFRSQFDVSNPNSLDVSTFTNPNQGNSYGNFPTNFYKNSFLHTVGRLNQSPFVPSPTGPLTANLVSYYKFDENTGNNVKDSLNINPGTWTGTLGNQWQTIGKANSSGNFNSSDNSVLVPTDQSLQFTKDFTITAWIYPKSLGAASLGRIVDKTSNEYAFQLNTNNRLSLQNGGGAQGFSQNNAVTLNQWNFVAVKYSSNGQIATFYSNAVIVGTDSTVKDPVAGINNLFIGNNAAGTRGFDGYIGEVGLWNRALDNYEISALYNNSQALTYPFVYNTKAVGVFGYNPYSQSQTVNWQTSFLQTIKRVLVPSSGIAFDLAANSADIAASNSYSGSAVWNGSNRILTIDVSMLGAGVTVTAMTYGGANCTFIGAQSTVTAFGRVESWRILQSDAGAPAAGSNTLSVTLSGSLEFSVEWVSYTGVHQDSPTEGFNSNQATNAGSATDATVAVTTVADNDWVHAAVVANDTSITAGQTTRNNIAGTLGSGGNEDNNGPKTPAGVVNMNYTGMGITTTWAITGYALRPIAASSLLTGGGNDWPAFMTRGFWAQRF